MPNSQYSALKVRAKTNEVKDYHYDDSRPGKPLYLLIPGGLIALASLALEIYIIYRTWFEGTLDTDTGIMLALLLAPFYIGGVFLFSYGYELYDVPRALRLTAIIVFITLAAVVIIAVLFLLVGGGSKSSSSSSSSSKSKSSSSSGSSSSGGSSGSYRSGSGFDVGPIFLGGNTRTVTREVVREVPVKPPEPKPIQCSYCGRSYIPKETKYTCPACGASTTAEQIAESEAELNTDQNNRTGD